MEEKKEEKKEEKCWICGRTEEEVREEVERKIVKEYNEDIQDAKLTLEKAIDERNLERESIEYGFPATPSNMKRVLRKRETSSLVPELFICIACESLIFAIGEESACREINRQIEEGTLLNRRGNMLDRRSKLVIHVEH